MNVDELANQCYEDIGKALRIVKRSYHELLKLRIQSNISIAEYESWNRLSLAIHSLALTPFFHHLLIFTLGYPLETLSHPMAQIYLDLFKIYLNVAERKNF